MTVPKVILKTGRERRVQEGHLWVFSNEIKSADGFAEPGALADIFTEKRKFIGRGFYNPHSLIAARILTRQDEEINQNFFCARISKAHKIRTLLYPEDSSYRLVFGESDFLPGLVIDRYENHFVVQSYCLGTDILLPAVFKALKEIFPVESIVKKNDSPIRKLESLKEEIEIVNGKVFPPIRFEQSFNSLKLSLFCDPIEGQKTGYYFDQRENRERLSVYCKGKSVLDCFSYTGGFGIYAAKNGAKEVVCVETGEHACKLLQKNAELNNVPLQILREDVFELLSRFQKEKRKFDIIILDPPGYAKSKKDLFGALRKYEKLNELAIGILNSGGVLFSCSCSHHVKREEFISMISHAAFNQGRDIQILEMRGQSRDHPVLPGMPETEYLKCAVLRSE